MIFGYPCPQNSEFDPENSVSYGFLLEGKTEGPMGRLLEDRKFTSKFEQIWRRYLHKS